MSRDSRELAVAVALVSTLAASGCRDSAARAWLYCDECPGTLLSSVEARGNRAVPTLALALQEPTAAALQAAELRTASAWQSIAEEGARRGAPRTSDDSIRFADRAVRDGFAEAQYRAVLALEKIKGRAARVALERFILRDTTGVTGVRPNVRRRAINALATF